MLNIDQELLTNLNNQNNEIYAFTPIENQTLTNVTYLKKIIEKT